MHCMTAKKDMQNKQYVHVYWIKIITEQKALLHSVYSHFYVDDVFMPCDSIILDFSNVVMHVKRKLQLKAKDLEIKHQDFNTHIL